MKTVHAFYFLCYLAALLCGPSGGLWKTVNKSHHPPEKTGGRLCRCPRPSLLGEPRAGAVQNPG